MSSDIARMAGTAVSATATTHITTSTLLSSSSGGRLNIEILSAKGLASIHHQQSQLTGDNLQSMQLNILFRKETKQSHTVVSSNENELVIDYGTSFNIVNHDIPNSLLASEDTNHVLVYITSSSVSSVEQQPIGSKYTKSLIAMAILDYRMAFIYGGECISVELIPQDADGINFADGIGSLFVRLSLSGVSLPYASISALESAIEFDIQRHSDISRNIHQSARSFWSKARRDYPFLEARDIKMFAEDECGQHRMVSSFLSPIIPSRDIDNPKVTARFVSLLPFKREISLTGGRRCTWQSPFAFLSTLQGDVEDHALFLCSLLLGWGMDAYIAIGTISSPAAASSSSKRSHMWVVTMDAEAEGKVVFWETLTGQQYDIAIDHTKKGKFVCLKKLASVDANKAKSPFLELHALFKSDTFLLNVQRSPILQLPEPNDYSIGTSGVSFNLRDNTCWLQYNGFKEYSSLLRHPGSVVHMRSNPATYSESYSLELQLESSIKTHIQNLRLDKGLQTHFDDQLALILQTALSAYELDRTMGVSVGNSDFQCAVKRHVNKGECFKAYPTCHSHTHIDGIWKSLKQAVACREIMIASSNSSSTRHAVRTKIFQYPEGAMAVWIIIAVCYSV